MGARRRARLVVASVLGLAVIAGTMVVGETSAGASPVVTVPLYRYQANNDLCRVRLQSLSPRRVLVDDLRQRHRRAEHALRLEPGAPGLDRAVAAAGHRPALRLRDRGEQPRGEGRRHGVHELARVQLRRASAQHLGRLRHRRLRLPARGRRARRHAGGRAVRVRGGAAERRELVHDHDQLDL